MKWLTLLDDDRSKKEKVKEMKLFMNWNDVEALVSEKVMMRLRNGYVLDTAHNNTCYGGVKARYFVKSEEAIISIDIEEKTFETEYNGTNIKVRTVVVSERKYYSDRRMWAEDADEILSSKTFYALPNKDRWADVEELVYCELYDYACQSMVEHDRRIEKRYEEMRNSWIKPVIKSNEKLVEIVRHQRGHKRAKASDVVEVLKRVSENFRAGMSIEYVVVMNEKANVSFYYNVDENGNAKRVG